MDATLTTPDFLAMIRTSATDPERRKAAGKLFAGLIDFDNPFTRDHGGRVLRPSAFGSCSLAFAAEAAGQLDLPAGDENWMSMDTGTLMGVWIACLLALGVERDQRRYGVAVETVTSYRDIPGHVDVRLDRFDEAGIPERSEPIEIKTSPTSGQLQAPDARKVYQCLQAGHYGLGIGAERFHVLTFGYNVGSNREGVPYPKARQDTYNTADYKPLIDAEIDRLTALSHLSLDELRDRREELADADGNYRCGSCRYSACHRNLNPVRYAL